MRKTTTLILLLVLARGLSAQAPPAAPADPVAPSKALKVAEKAAPGQDSGDCPDDQSVCYADIESTLLIHPDISFLDGAGATETGAAGDSSLPLKRQALLDALEALRSSLELSRQVIEAAAAASEDPEILTGAQALSVQFATRQRELINALDRYVIASAAEFGLPPNPSRDQIDEVLGDALLMRRGNTDEWIARELRRVDQQASARTETLKAGSELLVRLGAFRIRPGAEPLPLNLPGYDEIPPGELKPFRRVSFELTEEQKKQLEEETKFNAEVIAKIAALRAEAAASGSALKALADEAKALAEGLQENLDEVQAELDQHLGGIGSGLAGLRTSVETLQTSVKDLKADLDGLTTALDVATVDVAADRPDLVLLSLLGKLAPLQDGAPFREVLAQADKLRESVEDVNERLSTAPAAVRDALQETLQKALTAAAEDSGPLAQLAVKLSSERLKLTAGKMEETAKNLGAILTVEMSDPRRFDIAGDKVVPTDLQILRADPEPGDTIELVLEVRRRPAAGLDAEQGRLVHAERKSVRVDVYGWSSGIATGIGMIKAMKTDLANFEPSALALWRLGFQPRPGAAGLGRLGSIRPGIGIHVATLDFDPDNPAEFGAGVALNLFKDLVQVGYGWNLNVEDDRQYWYLGIGLFSLLKGQ